MPWLYEHRYQLNLDGLESLVEIAHWVVISHVPPDDQDDVEQEIVISLLQTIEKYGNKVGIDGHNLSSRGKAYLTKTAINRRNEYFLKKYREWSLWHIEESDGEEWAGGISLASHDDDIDARLDAKATLATLTERLIQIGRKILNEENLSNADQAYRLKQLRKLRPKLNCRKCANHLSDWERKRILQLYLEDKCVHKIALAMGRSVPTILRVLDGQQLASRRNQLAKEKDERIRQAYFVDRKSTSIIARDFHYGIETVYLAIENKQPNQSRLAKKEIGAKERDEQIRHAYFVDRKKIRQISRDFHCHHSKVSKAIRSGGYNQGVGGFSL
ncbi:hypothetical protein ES705_31711 [subsurface metagenome]